MSPSSNDFFNGVIWNNYCIYFFDTRPVKFQNCITFWFGGALGSDFNTFLSVSNLFISGVFVSTEIDKYLRHNLTTKDPIIIITFSSHVSNIAKLITWRLRYSSLPKRNVHVTPK